MFTELQNTASTQSVKAILEKRILGNTKTNAFGGTINKRDLGYKKSRILIRQKEVGFWFL